MTNAASEYFNRNWELYTESVNSGALFHQEMYATFGAILNDHFPDQAFSIADFGCGDLRSTAKLLSAPVFKIKNLIGVDGAADVLNLARANTAHLACEKTFMCEDMLSACAKLPDASLDVIFSSYALHHYSLAQKEAFLQNCQRVLRPDGIFVLVDGVRARHQTREQWIEVLESNFLAKAQHSPKDHEQCFEHVRSSDFPETLETFASIAQKQAWKKFQIALDKGHCACQVFSK